MLWFPFKFPFNFHPCTFIVRIVIICTFLPTHTRACYCSRNLAILDTYYNKHDNVFSLSLFSGLFLLHSLFLSFSLCCFLSISSFFRACVTRTRRRLQNRSHTRSVRGKVNETYGNRFIKYNNIITSLAITDDLNIFSFGNQTYVRRRRPFTIVVVATHFYSK